MGFDCTWSGRAKRLSANEEKIGRELRWNTNTFEVKVVQEKRCMFVRNVHRPDLNRFRKRALVIPGLVVGEGFRGDCDVGRHPAVDGFGLLAGLSGPPGPGPVSNRPMRSRVLMVFSFAVGG